MNRDVQETAPRYRGSRTAADRAHIRARAGFLPAGPDYVLSIVIGLVAETTCAGEIVHALLDVGAAAQDSGDLAYSQALTATACALLDAQSRDSDPAAVQEVAA